MHFYLFNSQKNQTKEINELKHIIEQNNKEINELKHIIEQNNKGKKWSNDEELLLFEELKNNITIEIIAKKHGRTYGAIDSRINLIAYKMFCEKVPINEIIYKTKLKKDAIERAIEKYQNKIS
jgi:hypothetical protein